MPNENGFDPNQWRGQGMILLVLLQFAFNFYHSQM